MNLSRKSPVALGLALAGAALLGAWLTAPLAAAEPAAAPAAKAAPAPSAAPSSAKVLATVDNTTITQQDVEAVIIKQILTSQPNVIDQVLEQAIRDRLLDLEAAKQKLTKEELLNQEARSKVAKVTDADIDKFYEEKKAQIRVPKEQVTDRIRQYLENQRQQAAIDEYLAKLEKQHAVKNMLQEQRDAEEIQKAAERRALIDDPSAPSFGPKDAPVVLVEFSDFQCPFCSRVVPSIEQVRKNYPNNVRVVYRQFPLTSIHPNAQKAAEASLCAQEQGKFWEMYDAMFKEQDKLDVPSLKEKAQKIGLKTDQFNACLDNGKYAPKVQAEVELGSKIGVNGTPALFVNGRQVPGGAAPYESIARLIDDELQRAKAKGGK